MNFEKIVGIIEEELGVEASKINLNSNLKSDLNADSLDLVELIMKVEDEFGIKIEEEHYSELTTVQSILDYIEKVNK